MVVDKKAFEAWRAYQKLTTPFESKREETPYGYIFYDGFCVYHVVRAKPSGNSP